MMAFLIGVIVVSITVVVLALGYYAVNVRVTNRDWGKDEGRY